MLLKRILTWVTNPQPTEQTANDCVDHSPNQPQTLYEHIAQGNALEEAEAYARRQWRSR